MSDLSPEELTQYATIIDRILKDGDLNTISAKQIRKDLQAALGFDISHKKDEVKKLIMERFDEASKNSPEAGVSPPTPTTNGHNSTQVKDEASPTISPKREAGDSDEDASSSKKKAKRQKQDDDAKLAAMLQAQENSRTRSTRGGGTKRSAAVKKATPKKKKSSAKVVKGEDDSDIEVNSDGEPKEVVRKGGFHKQYHLSTPLADLVGEPSLSRPQVVKKIWQHIKAHELQDPSDKRQIICDEKLYAVFKSERVHMFTMNKLLGKQLYPIEDE